MGKASIDVISRYTKPWPKDDPTNYYAEFWKKWFKEELDAYCSAHGIHSRSQEIAVYYDSDGELHVVKCDDPVLEDKIKKRMDSWYSWVCKKEFDNPHACYNIGMLIYPYVSPLKEGFYQIRYRDMVCNLSAEQYDSLSGMSVIMRRKEGSEYADPESDIPALNKILSEMIRHGDIFPISGEKIR